MKRKVKHKDDLLRERMEREMMKSLLEADPEEEIEEAMFRRQQSMVKQQLKIADDENDQLKLQNLRIRSIEN